MTDNLSSLNNLSPLAALKLENISYHHNDQSTATPALNNASPALDHISVTFEKNKKTFILGPNGAGKSLLLYICHDLLKPSSGKVILSADNSRQAMVFAKPALLRRSVLENIKYTLELSQPKTDVTAEALRALKVFKMEELQDIPARHLSSGEQQRLAIICALLRKPDILFLDEPSSNLDPHAALKLENMIEECRAHGMSIIMASHDLAQARRLADTIIYMEEGRIIEQTPAREFFSKPRTPEAYNFINGILS
jgi:tungstate transport system ATP-binding protein